MAWGNLGRRVAALEASDRSAGGLHIVIVNGQQSEAEAISTYELTNGRIDERALLVILNKPETVAIAGVL